MSMTDEMNAILAAFKDEKILPIIKPILDEAFYMRNKLLEYKKELDAIVAEGITPKNKGKYAFYNKLYLDTDAKFTTTCTLLLRYAANDETEETSPLRAFLDKVNRQ